MKLLVATVALLLGLASATQAADLSSYEMSQLPDIKARLDKIYEEYCPKGDCPRPLLVGQAPKGQEDKAPLLSVSGAGCFPGYGYCAPLTPGGIGICLPYGTPCPGYHY